MSLCPICWHSLGVPGDQYYCPRCREKYRIEIEQMKKFPPGLSEEAKETFGYEQWTKFKILEYRLQNQLITVDAAKIELRKLVDRLNAAPAKLRRSQQLRQSCKNLVLY